MRGVACGGVIRTLQDRGLIDVIGRAEGLGRPLLYGTTQRFLDHFGFRSIEDLPRPEELPVVLRERVPLGPLEDELPVPEAASRGEPELAAALAPTDGPLGPDLEEPERRRSDPSAPEEQPASGVAGHVRIQKLLSRAGVASRRAAETLMGEGRVRVNGRAVTTLGAQVDPERDVVEVGRPPGADVARALDRPPQAGRHPDHPGGSARQVPGMAHRLRLAPGRARGAPLRGPAGPRHRRPAPALERR